MLTWLVQDLKIDSHTYIHTSSLSAEYATRAYLLDNVSSYISSSAHLNIVSLFDSLLIYRKYDSIGSWYGVYHWITALRNSIISSYLREHYFAPWGPRISYLITNQVISTHHPQQAVSQGLRDLPANTQDLKSYHRTKNLIISYRVDIYWKLLSQEMLGSSYQYELSILPTLRKPCHLVYQLQYTISGILHFWMQ